MNPVPDSGEESYCGSGRLMGKKAVMHRRRQWHRPCRGDRLRPGGADVLIAYLDEHEDANDVARRSRMPGIRRSTDPPTPGSTHPVVRRSTLQVARRPLEARYVDVPQRDASCS